MMTRPTALAGREVHLWTVRLDRPAAEVARLGRSLSADEHGRAAGYCFEADRRRFTVARAALRHVLAGYLGNDAAALRFEYGTHGKPSLCRDTGAAPVFNVAHSGELALIAVAGMPGLGVDLECIRPLDDVCRTAQQVCSAAERRALEALPGERRVPAFLRCWTRKEACVKAMGTGLSTPVEQLHVGCSGAPEGPDAWMLHDLDPAPGFVGALATPAGGCRITPFVFHAPTP